MTTVLVTGGAGYIGSHTCKALHKAGFTPVTFDNLVSGHEWAVKWGPLVKGDILDRSALAAAFQKYNPKAVLHFAAFAYVGESVANPGKYYRNNVAGSINLLEAMRDAGCHYMVFSSTCATYGIPETIPIPEDHPQNPITPYGRSKLMIEQILRDFQNAHDIRGICLRYFNAAGADPDGELGEAHDPETHLIPLAIQAALGKRDHLDIYGTDYPTPDGTAIRDYVHVTDLADAHVIELQQLFSGQSIDALNLGTGEGISVKQMIETIERTLNKKVLVKYAPRRSGDPPMLVADAKEAFKTLGWRPRFSSIEDIIKTASKWHEFTYSEQEN